MRKAYAKIFHSSHKVPQGRKHVDIKSFPFILYNPLLTCVCILYIFIFFLKTEYAYYVHINELYKIIIDDSASSEHYLLPVVFCVTGCNILAKAEFCNGGGSVKDRAALYLIKDAEKKGNSVVTS